MHVFLTGPVQIGKSTLLRASLDALQPQKLGGFRTVSAQPQADGSRPVYLHPACSPDELHESANRVGIRRPGLGIVSFPAAFETAGLAALAGAEDCDLLLMDEIGRENICQGKDPKTAGSINHRSACFSVDFRIL